MHVIVLTKRKWVTILICFLIMIVAATLAIVYFCSDKDEAPAAPAMAVVESYELQTIPYTAKEVPVYRVNRDDNVLALTIDAAWDADKTDFILDTLDKYDAKATFFLCGVWVNAYPDKVKEIAARGHVIGNHSLTHPHMNRLTADQIKEEIVGEYNDTVVKTVRELGYEIVQWDIDSIDWKENRSEETILNTVLPKLKSGSIILSHNNGYHIETYLPKLLEKAKEQGYRFVTVPELLPDGEHHIDVNGVWQSN